MSQFYLTLPSNSSEVYYPDNTVTQFTTRLHNSFNLTGEWEVGMTEIMFPHSWYNVTRNSCYFRIQCKGGLKTEPNSLAPKDYDLEIALTSGYYKSVTELITALNNMIERTYSLPIQALDDDSVRIRVEKSEWPKFRCNPLGMKFMVSLPAMSRMTFGTKLSDILGLGMDQNPMLNDTNRVVMRRAARVCDLEGGLHAIYVYCDLLESVPVGDTSAKLLGIVASDGRMGETLKKSFIRPRYIPLQKKSFDSVEIFIRDAHGNPIAFENGRSTVTLQFRRVKDSYFLG